jgi:hypothetical protein
MRKWLASFCLALAFFTQAGYYGIFAVEQAMIREAQKRKMLSQLDDASLEAIPEQQGMQFVDGGKEFYLHGELYDVVRTRTLNGKKIFLALNDKQESLLMKKLGDAGRASNHASKKGALKFATIFFEGFDENHFPIIVPGQDIAPIPQESLLNRTEDIIPPPPDRA